MLFLELKKMRKCDHVVTSEVEIVYSMKEL